LGSTLQHEQSTPGLQRLWLAVLQHAGPYSRPQLALLPAGPPALSWLLCLWPQLGFGQVQGFLAFPGLPEEKQQTL